VLNTKLDGIAMQPHQSSYPANLVIVHNTVVKSTGAAIYLNGNRGPVVIANNAMYSKTGKSLELSHANNTLLTLAGNVGFGHYDGLTGFKRGNVKTDFVSGHFRGMPPIDLHLAAHSALIGAADRRFIVEQDFDGQQRNRSPDTGAYALHSTRARLNWALSGNFKGRQDTPVTAMTFKQQPLPPWGCVPTPAHE